MLTAVYGGSFDPPHRAHRLAVEHLLSDGGFAKVLVVPVNEHAFDKRLASFEHRVAMCEIAMRGCVNAEISRVESELPPPNYTLNTLKAISQRYPSDDFRLVVGADVLDETGKWHAFDQVVRLAPLYPLGRQGVKCAGAPPPFLPDVSSTEVRRLLRTRGSSVPGDLERRLASMLDRDVLAYIDQHDLYR